MRRLNSNFRLKTASSVKTFRNTIFANFTSLIYELRHEEMKELKQSLNTEIRTGYNGGMKCK